MPMLRMRQNDHTTSHNTPASPASHGSRRCFLSRVCCRADLSAAPFAGSTPLAATWFLPVPGHQAFDWIILGYHLMLELSRLIKTQTDKMEIYLEFNKANESEVK